MRVLVLILILLSSSKAYAEWTKLGENAGGDTFYVDFDRIRKVDGYVYWWILGDYLKPLSIGVFSAKTYQQGDCKQFRYKVLSWSFHKEPIGGGTGERDNRPDKEWEYPPPNSVEELFLNAVCDRAK